MFGWLTTAAEWLFNKGSNKGIVEQVSDVADKWNPSPVTQSKMSIDEQQAGDVSQDSARKLVLPTHDTWFDVLIDGWSRAIRPAVSTWAFGGLAGLWPLPQTGSIDPLIGNIIWTIVGFWFGTRMIFKDIPNALRALKSK